MVRWRLDVGVANNRDRQWWEDEETHLKRNNNVEIRKEKKRRQGADKGEEEEEEEAHDMKKWDWTQLRTSAVCHLRELIQIEREIVSWWFSLREGWRGGKEKAETVRKRKVEMERKLVEADGLLREKVEYVEEDVTNESLFFSENGREQLFFTGYTTCSVTLNVYNPDKSPGVRTLIVICAFSCISPLYYDGKASPPRLWLKPFRATANHFASSCGQTVLHRNYFVS